ncbi:serine/threonine-protein phosphatase 6 regulatory ankyrin repeat subunit C-like [Halichondria panicea]|uniref:serine/threonine-protein phosphatase 6 regulatory ankyrin repeat subunit C-like n=1 Tax=Halichondria panicea TaxID=6063 RepID=UPI00312BA17B
MEQQAEDWREPVRWQGRQQAEKLLSTVNNGDVRKVKSLLARGADPNHPDCFPLHRACLFGYLEIVKALVEAGADPERKNKEGLSPVHYAASNGHKELLVYLIRDCKASANTRDQFNNTPLHYACYDGDLDMVQYLVEKKNC